MGKFIFSEADRQQIRSRGISEAQALAQIEIFKQSSFFLRLKRPCTLKSGVQRIPLEETEKYLKFHSEAAHTGRFQKFVPASGAATRMFQSLLQIYYMPQYLECDELHLRAEHGVAVACDFLQFMYGLQRFAFYDDLKAALAKDGLSLTTLAESGQFRTILDYLLMDHGLKYGSLPKGLLKFHRYAAECRTAFEEHLVEAAHYVANGNRLCAVHFTISPEHEKMFLDLFKKAKVRYEERYEACYEVCFSFQKPSTDTIAVDLDNRPFRERCGSLHFRPGGHGALLENLNDLEADLFYIKNVDNLCPDHLKETSTFWKKVLGGYLVEMQGIVHGYIRSLTDDPQQQDLGAVERFATERFLIRFPTGYEHWPPEQKRDFLVGKLNRPMRVCGVVPNAGHPGGAPFWVEDRFGELSIQIVEQAQVDLSSPEQRDIWTSSTHFNPVDLVCAIRDYRGKPFDLMRYVDPNAVFISKKSRDGRELKALELPGLWNGSMADWITLVVEVPGITFNPVKTVHDLLRPEHQPKIT